MVFKAKSNPCKLMELYACLSKNVHKVEFLVQSINKLLCLQRLTR